ncbi:MAG TPA: transglycosylase SLT domain-containing protein [Burkholderiales bacterium]|nr:transglycosylase SLT domain-containing protein [Burkholderiales bacterium]
MRIGSINTGGLQGIERSSIVRGSRKFVSILALVASVAALVLIVEAQHGQSLFAGQRSSIEATQAGAGGKQLTALTPAEESRYRALSDYVARRYRVSQDVAFDLVSHAHWVGGELQVDPLLIIAVISVESSFNPIAESVAGAKGLMQIIPRYHGDKLEVYGGAEAVFDPATNIQVGAQILKEYIRRTGNVGIALQMYNGALSDTDDQYTNKVMGVKQRLQHVVSQPLHSSSPAPVRNVSARNNIVFPLSLD